MEETIARLVQAFVAFGIAYTLALWIALVFWTWRDIASRSTNALVQIFSVLVVLLFFAPGAIIYLILRPRETLDEAFQRAMADEYIGQDLEEFPTCPSCRRGVHDDYVFCPHCRAELRRTCPACGKLASLAWAVCAYCGLADPGAPASPAAFGSWSADGIESRQASRRNGALSVDATTSTGQPASTSHDPAQPGDGLEVPKQREPATLGPARDQG